MSDINTLIDEAMALCARLNAKLSVIAAKVAMREPGFRHFRQDGVIWRASEYAVVSRPEHRAEWSADSMLTLNDLTSSNTLKATVPAQALTASSGVANLLRMLFIMFTSSLPQINPI